MERIKDLKYGKGFVISESQTIKKDLKSPNSIFSSRFGQTLQDANPFIDRYKCDCGYLKSRIHHNILCPQCNTRVKYIDDDFNYFGWLCLKDPYYIIHPNLYKSIEFIIGQDNMEIMLKVEEAKDENGHVILTPKQTSHSNSKSKDYTYKDIGMINFVDRFDEILSYFIQKNPNKREYYDDIMAHRDLVFSQSIPVYTALLRPFSIEGNTFIFEGVNKIYQMMSKLSSCINIDHLTIFRTPKTKNNLLYDLQVEYNKLYKELEDILSHKKGIIRSLFGGRYNFTSRSVIIPNPKLRIDEITLPYHALVELLQQTIVNILQKSYNISYSDAYKIWYKSQIKRSQKVYDIINYIIKDQPRGLPMLINKKSVA